ncbi:MAG TPA: AraC family transcriptional regulator [Myxococcaceae bacterium]|nr:AraC family transcriptional regulator [Myxococcaceae bacterium]
MDALEDALAELRVRCVLLPEGAASSPWQRDFPEDAVSLHVLIRGQCHIQIPVPVWVHRLVLGEILLVNRGVGGRLRATSESDDPPRVLSARLDFEAPHGHPLLDSLPPVVQASVNQVPSPRSFGPLLDALLAELDVPLLGRDEIVRRLCEALLVQALRTHLHRLNWTDTGWLRVLADPVIKAQLAPQPREEASRATVRELARCAGRSPRGFRARFKKFAGFTPSSHCRQAHARRAAKLLRQGETDLARIAHLTGYRSRQGLCRAFKRELGVSPAAYWRSVHGRRFPRRPSAPTRGDAATDRVGRTASGSADRRDPAEPE